MTEIIGGFCRMSGAQVSGVEISDRHAPHLMDTVSASLSTLQPCDSGGEAHIDGCVGHS